MMRAFWFVFFLTFVLITSCKTDREKFPDDTTVDAQLVFDFGEVMQGELVKAKFEIINTGNAPLKIFEVKPSCGCTLANYTKEAVEPGESAWVEAEVDTKGMSGTINKSVTVMANTQPTAITLQITGKVLSKEN
jgi:hypothetical protein